MKQSLLYNIPSFIIALLLVIAMLLCYYFGCYVKARKIARHPDHKDEGLGSIEGALLGLLALLLSFTFSMSSTRHDNRFQVMVEEANSISTAILRADLFPDTERRVLRNYFKSYVEDRIAQYDAGNNTNKNIEAALQTQMHADSLWKLLLQLQKVRTLL